MRCDLESVACAEECWTQEIKRSESAKAKMAGWRTSCDGDGERRRDRYEGGSIGATGEEFVRAFADMYLAQGAIETGTFLGSLPSSAAAPGRGKRQCCAGEEQFETTTPLRRPGIASLSRFRSPARPGQPERSCISTTPSATIRHHRSGPTFPQTFCRCKAANVGAVL
ncbi:hypothetical protein KC325_g138 [Hortaea werneckii]|nr:hypothetical protein KC325_g138 [Hortaea werneckii]